VQFGVNVESVEPAREDPSQNGTTSTSIAGHSSRALRPTVRLKTGEVLHADVIIGADGWRSIVRRVVEDEDEAPPEATPVGWSMFTGCVPMTEVRKCPPLKQLADAGWTAWIGDGRAILGTLISFTFHNDPACDVRLSPRAFTDRSLRASRLSNSEFWIPSGGGYELMISGASFIATAP
jgi:2-polyprenyl-6-methoxyphenol hydroxylase-like FAD-dependent oxidoreductase